MPGGRATFEQIPEPEAFDPALERLTQALDTLSEALGTQEERHPDRHRPAMTFFRRISYRRGLIVLRNASASAICTALSAAPLRILSATTQKLRPFGTLGSRRKRET